MAAAYGKDSGELERFDGIRYSLSMWTDTTPDSAFDRAKMRGLRQAVETLRAMIEDMEESQGDAQPAVESVSTRPKVFVVHGRDEAARERVARFLERLGMEPIILHEKTDRGRTVLEKFEHHSLGVRYAVILLSPDDYARGPDDTDWPATPNRARQNVILELGYFMGSLGRQLTAALYMHGTELPSDIHGMLYIPFDSSWEVRLAKEMRDAGLPVDLNLL